MTLVSLALVPIFGSQATATMLVKAYLVRMFVLNGNIFLRGNKRTSYSV